MNMINATARVLNDEIPSGLSSLESEISSISPSERILLIPHCLRDSQNCKAKTEKSGLACVQCTKTCQVNQLKAAAEGLGYKCVCVAPGGSLALKYVKEMNPRGIVAVACPKELEEGVDNVAKLAGEANIQAPPIMIVPLVKDGCIDTKIDMASALQRMSLGCAKDRVKQTYKKLGIELY